MVAGLPEAVIKSSVTRFLDEESFWDRDMISFWNKSLNGKTFSYAPRAPGTQEGYITELGEQNVQSVIACCEQILSELEREHAE